MPGPASHGGWRRHMSIARCAANQLYGALPVPLVFHDVPILADGMKLKATSPRFEPNTTYRPAGGVGYLRHVAIHHQQVVEGDVTTLLWPELSQFLLDMALLRVDDVASQNHQDLYGHAIDHYTPPDPRRYLGVVANTLRLAVSAMGEKDAQLTLSLIAQREEENNALLETDFAYAALTLTPFMASFATIQVDGAVVADVENWTLTVENGIGEAPFHWNAAAQAGVRAYAKANKRRISLELTDLNNDDRYNEAIRDANLITFYAHFDHPDGHVLDIVLPSLYVPESPEDGTPDAQATEAPRLEAMVAIGGTYAGQDIAYSVALAGGGGSTLAPLTTPAPATTTTAAPATTTTAAPAPTTTTL